MNANLIKIASNKVPLKADRAKYLYLSGQMTGLPNYNFDVFNAKAAELKSIGWTVCNPASHGLVSGADRLDYLRYDAAQLSTCSAIYLLTGWENSEGARCTNSVAMFAYELEQALKGGKNE